MQFATLHLRRLDLALDACMDARASWSNEQKPSWKGFHRLLDAWHSVLEISTRLNVWMESRQVDETVRLAVQEAAHSVSNANNFEAQDVAFRKQLWRWTHSPSFKKLNDDQQQAARSALSSTLTARWPKYKQYQLNRLAAEQAEMEERFSANLRRDQSTFGVYFTRLGPLVQLPLENRQMARKRATENGWSGWWFEANDTNYAAFRAKFVPPDVKRSMTLARKRVGLSGVEPADHNGTVLARLSELRRLEAKMHGETNYGAYAWGGNVFSTPRKMAAFLKSTHKAVDATPAPVVSKLVRDEYNSAFVSPSKTQHALWRLWEKRFGLRLKEVSPLSWLPEATRLAVRKGNRLVGHVVLDLFHRPNKPKTGLSGYMVDLVKRHRDADGTLRRPVSYVSMDTSTKKWNHYNVATFFHEMGHALHHLSAASELPATNWDAIEGDATEWPSLLMESWSWEDGVVSRLFGAERIGSFQKVRQQSRYNAMVSGLQVAWLDLKMHASRRARQDHPLAWVEETKEYIPQLKRLLSDDWARWDHLTIMQGTYAGYLWSEQLASKIGQHVHSESSSFDWEAFWDAVWVHGGRKYVCDSLEEWKPGVTSVSASAFLQA